MAQDRIISIGRYVDEPVVEVQRDVDFRMLDQKPAKRGAKVQYSKAHRRRYPERTRERPALRSKLGLGFVGLPQYALRAREKASPALGERQFARRALDQFRAERFFEIGETFTDDRRRQSEAFGGGADRARFGCRKKGCYSGELHHLSGIPASRFGFIRLVRRVPEAHDLVQLAAAVGAAP
ncbi:hypothetical protein GGC65_004060 [Sphingopyxis sp. OAS728]|nr:hypothetical protein [Sphingopyxis sp. OAS728]